VAGYLIRRVFQAAATTILVTLIVYLLLRLAPGSTERSLTGRAGPGLPVLGQYLGWLGRVLGGNLGVSVERNVTVAGMLAASLPRTLALALIATAIALAVSIPLGLLQAVRRNSVTDHVVTGLTFLFYGTPSFVLGSVLVVTLADQLRLFGAEGPQAPGIAGVITDWRDLTLPVLTLALLLIALFTRYLRAAALDSLAEDYVRAARAKGAGERQVLTGHVLRNSLIPVVTLVGMSIPQILGGTLVTESVFNIQGMGWQFWQAAQDSDYPVLLGFALVLGVLTVLGSLAADLCYAAVDPRIRYAAS
jgi:peptide/nickel transport system permease protein